jgi:hypothetical protein
MIWSFAVCDDLFILHKLNNIIKWIYFNEIDPIFFSGALGGQKRTPACFGTTLKEILLIQVHNNMK